MEGGTGERTSVAETPDSPGQQNVVQSNNKVWWTGGGGTGREGGGVS